MYAAYLHCGMSFCRVLQVNIGTLANRLDKLDNKFGLIEREARCSAPLAVCQMQAHRGKLLLRSLYNAREVATIAAMTEEFVHNTASVQDFLPPWSILVTHYIACEVRHLTGHDPTLAKRRLTRHEC